MGVWARPTPPHIPSLLLASGFFQCTHKKTAPLRNRGGSDSPDVDVLGEYVTGFFTRVVFLRRDFFFDANRGTFVRATEDHAFTLIEVNDHCITLFELTLKDLHRERTLDMFLQGTA